MKKSQLKELIKSSFLEEAEEFTKSSEVTDEGMSGTTYEETVDEANSDAINPGNTKDDQSKKDDYDYDSRPSHMKEAEDVDIEDNEDIDVDIEDEVDIDDKSDKSEIEVDSELAGESAEVAAILGLLTKAQEEAKGLGDEKLLDQIGNTITYYTRAHVVASTNEDLESGKYSDPVDAELDITKGGDDVAGILDAEAELNLQEVKRFRKLAGLIK